MKRKSLFQVRKSKDDMRFPWVTTAGGSSVTKHRTKTEALNKVRAARKKEKALLARFAKD